MSLLSLINLGKAFRSYYSEWHRFASWFGVHVAPSEEHWVLRYVNLEIQPGETIGIIGKNGAGKSTLLKMITGTLQPTEGLLQVNGRIAAILELGMGFNPELTGRQNVFQSAGLMGFDNEKVKFAMQGIEEFAEIGDYFDAPMRTYSSGMQARVAFAVATAFRPEILIVDEVLSVGDAAFQRKCFRRIEGFQKKGTTMLLVSHDIETVKKLCDKALFIKEGEIESFGKTKNICDDYEKYIFGEKVDGAQKKKERRPANKKVVSALYDVELETNSSISYGDGRATITDVWFEDALGKKVNTVQSGNKFSVNYIVEAHQHLENIVFSIMIKTREGIAVYGTDTRLINANLHSISGSEKIHISFQLNNYLAPGVYYLNCGVRDYMAKESIFLCRKIDTAIFKVASSKVNTIGPGLVELLAKVEILEKKNV